MRLVLNNFRQHTSLDLELPDSGIIMLQGPSGAGKSTILDAILEAWTGDADDVAPWGSTHASVELFLNKPEPIQIKRTRGPKTLTVTYGGSEYKDEAGQAIIDKLFGSTHEILAARYITQGMDKSLLSLGPADQLRFIQKLGAGKRDPEEDRERIKRLIDRREAALSVAVANRTNTAELLKEADKLLAQVVVPEPKLPVSPELLAGQLELYSLNQQELRDVDAQTAKISKELKNPVYALLETIDRQESETTALIESHKSEFENISSEAAKLGEVETLSPGELSALKSKIDSKKKRIEIINQIKAIGDSVLANYPAYTKASDAISGRLAEVNEALKRLQAEQDTVKAESKELLTWDNHIPCPECSAPLALRGGSIVKAKAATFSVPERALELKNRLATIATTLSMLTNEREFLNNTSTQVALLKTLVPVDVPEITDVALALKGYDIELNKATGKIMSRESLSKCKIAIANKINNLQDALDKSKAVIAAEMAKGLKPKADLEKERAVADMTRMELGERLHKLEMYVEMNKNYQKECNLRDQELVRKTERAEAAKKRRQEAEKNEQAAQHAMVAVGAAKRLKELSDRAAVEAIELIIEEINEKAGEALDKMFPNDGTSIRIKNLSGDGKPKLSLEIFHKGKTPKKLSNLSGGERSRVKLAFQLALAEIYKSDLLMVDEGFAGLSEEDKKECLQVLKDASNDRLVLVIEHGAPESFFDQVITIG